MCLISQPNIVEGDPQGQYEKQPKEGVLWWQDDPALARECGIKRQTVSTQNLKGHGSWSETFCLIICEMSIKVDIPKYDNELKGLYAKHI